MLNYVSISEKLAEATSIVAELLKEAGYTERVEMTYELIAANKYGVA